MTDILERFRELSKLTTSAYPNAKVTNGAFPVVEKWLYRLLDETYTIDSQNYTTGEADVDEIAAMLCAQYAYAGIDGGMTINRQDMVTKFNQMALRQISFIYPSKVMYNPYQDKYYPKDERRGDAYTSIEYTDGSA